MSLPVEKEVSAMSRSELELMIPVFYQDETCYKVIIAYGGTHECLVIGDASGQAIAQAMKRDGTIKEQDGYDEDPHATIYYLFPNQYVRLMTEADRQKVAEAHYEMRQAKPMTRGRRVNGRYRYNRWGG